MPKRFGALGLEMVYQHFTLVRAMTVTENFGLRVAPCSARRSRASEADLTEIGRHMAGH